ncbi:MAG: DUF1549 domain-containing protein, partial [Planctomycetaceae bacterium]|nr:DUF1549 domain-containing protein [Planctomycetaceae bacterium]
MGPAVQTGAFIFPDPPLKAVSMPWVAAGRRLHILGLTSAIRFCHAAWLALVGAGAVAAAEPPARVDFARDIAPLLEQRCIRCHQASDPRGEISLATADALREAGYLVAGQPGQSTLLEVVSPTADGKPRMPQEGEPLSAEQVALLSRWIEQGAEWPKEIVLAERAKGDLSWWSLQPLRRDEPPDAAELLPLWRENPIDRFIGTRLRAEGLSPNPPADRTTLIRRVTYDLTGLPPTPEDVAAFVADSAPDAYERLVERLLAAPHYGEHWGRHWLDVVRFGESNGYEQNFLIETIWPFRDYVIESFNQDKPFDRLILEHLAGDSLAPGDPQVEVGLTFLVCGPYDSVGNQDAVQAAQIRANTVDEMIRTTAESFLGLTVGCARCHNHKFDPILQRDYYRMYATFAGVFHDDRVVATDEHRRQREEQLQPLVHQRGELEQQRNALVEAAIARAGEQLTATWIRPPAARTGTEERLASVEARFVRLVVTRSDTNPASPFPYKIDEFEIWTAGGEPRNVAAASAGAKAAGTSPRPGDFSEAYSADLVIDGEFGQRWTAASPELTIELARPEIIDRVFFSSDRRGTLGQHGTVAFVADYRIETSLDGVAWHTVADSRDRQPVSDAHRRQRLLDANATPAEKEQLAQLGRQIGELDGQIAAVPAPPSLRVGRLEQPAPEQFLFERGDPQRRGERVVPASLETLAHATPGYELAADAPEAQRRLALAQWIVAAGNPLPPRVLANRIWHYHFGMGIVNTPSDLGYMGGRPSYPELLDWLASRLQSEGWRLKPLHKLIVTSQAYQQSGDYRPAAAQVDADSRLLWRFPPRRLAGEEIRDAMLAAAGQLDSRRGGPGFRLYHYLRDNVSTYVPLDNVGPETYRRAVYHQNARAARIDLVTDFDAPDCAFPAPRRVGTTTPLQALTLMNHSFTVDMAARLAERVARDAPGEDRAAQIRRAFELTLSRPPSPAETAAATELIESFGMRAFCRALF